MRGKIRDSGLAPAGAGSCRRAASRMPALAHAERSLAKTGCLRGVAVGLCLQVTPETGALACALGRLGARVSACAGNPDTTHDDVAAYLHSQGMGVHAWRGQNAAAFERGILWVLEQNPGIVADDGGELSIAAHQTGLSPGTFGGTEETTTGVRRLRALHEAGRLRYPVIAVSEARTKRTLDSMHGTGQSTVDGLMRSAGLLFASKTVVVAGYGWVGRGVASRCRGMGSRVIVTEVDPIKALEAHMDGYEVRTMASAARRGDMFITCTGMAGVISARHMARMKDGAVLANAGHFDVEIDARYLRGRPTARVRHGLTRHAMPGGRALYLVSSGRVANLAAAEGHPPEAMDMSFALQLWSIARLARSRGRLGPALLPVFGADERAAARAALGARRTGQNS